MANKHHSRPYSPGMTLKEHAGVNSVLFVAHLSHFSVGCRKFQSSLLHFRGISLVSTVYISFDVTTVYEYYNI